MWDSKMDVGGVQQGRGGAVVEVRDGAVRMGVCGGKQGL